jgi:hypothetical protein
VADKATVNFGDTFITADPPTNKGTITITGTISNKVDNTDWVSRFPIEGAVLDGSTVIVTPTGVVKDPAGFVVIGSSAGAEFRCNKATLTFTAGAVGTKQRMLTITGSSGTTVTAKADTYTLGFVVESPVTLIGSTVGAKTGSENNDGFDAGGIRLFKSATTQGTLLVKEGAGFTGLLTLAGDDGRDYDGDPTGGGNNNIGVVTLEQGAKWQGIATKVKYDTVFANGGQANATLGATNLNANLYATDVAYDNASPAGATVWSLVDSATRKNVIFFGKLVAGTKNLQPDGTADIPNGGGIYSGAGFRYSQTPKGAIASIKAGDFAGDRIVYSEGIIWKNAHFKNDPLSASGTTRINATASKPWHASFGTGAANGDGRQFPLPDSLDGKTIDPKDRHFTIKIYTGAAALPDSVLAAAPQDNGFVINTPSAFPTAGLTAGDVWDVDYSGIVFTLD